ncbi:hypothetical protein [Burkholderia pseudomallei]|uniref:hypothetical protein n=1 Tax=Burkholderia pseudomallei TaxID=28450 RepID=UPI0009B24D1C|nr:hypothetical protein [Burkholderia pseudomallei]
MAVADESVVFDEGEHGRRSSSNPCRSRSGHVRAALYGGKHGPVYSADGVTRAVEAARAFTTSQHLRRIDARRFR